MCDECHQHPHATMCPNGKPMVNMIYVDCALCGAEVDEEANYYGICPMCWDKADTFSNALHYGETAQVDIKINGLFAKVLTPEQINIALSGAVLDMYKFYWEFTLKAAKEFLLDDSGDFADWLKAQKNID